MLNLAQELFKFDPERDWQPDEVRSDGQEHLRRYLGKILEILIRGLRADNGSVSLSGVSCGQFDPFVSIGRELHEIAPTIALGAPRNLIYDHLWSGPAIEELDALDARRNYRGREKRKLLIKLSGHGETFGYIVLNKRYRDDPFPADVVDQLYRVHDDLQWRIAEQVFSMRLRRLAEPLPMNIDAPSDLYARIMQQLVAGFAVDGGILRTYSPDEHMVKVEASIGELDDPLAGDQFEGEGIAGRIVLDAQSPWLIASNLGGPSPKIGGLQPLKEDLQRLIDHGVKAIIVTALRPNGDKTRAAIGTLSCFFRRPMEFSWRGVAMYQAFCQQVADVMTLRKQTVELRESHRRLELQNRLISHAEIVSLIAHDLFHKSLQTHSLAHTYIGKCRTALNDKKQSRTHEHLEKDAVALLESTKRLGNALEQIRAMQSSAEKYERKEHFNIERVLDDIAASLANPLIRANVSLDKRFVGSMDLEGPKSVIEQVFYNLFINSFDAIKLRRTNKPMQIHVRGNIDGVGAAAKIVIQFWDDGPGIDRVVFKNPGEIFELAATSKANGTGTGLPVARSLLGRYFKAEISLEEVSCARFKISIPRESD
jgi:signal transduction histidine kinase